MRGIHEKYKIWKEGPFLYDPVMMRFRELFFALPDDIRGFHSIPYSNYSNIRRRLFIDRKCTTAG